MSTLLIQSATLVDIGDAIREKLNTETQYSPSEMPDAIRSIQGRGAGVNVLTGDISYLLGYGYGTYQTQDYTNGFLRNNFQEIFVNHADNITNSHAAFFGGRPTSSGVQATEEIGDIISYMESINFDNPTDVYFTMAYLGENYTSLPKLTGTITIPPSHMIDSANSPLVTEIDYSELDRDNIVGTLVVSPFNSMSFIKNAGEFYKNKTMTITSKVDFADMGFQLNNIDTLYIPKLAFTLDTTPVTGAINIKNLMKIRKIDFQAGNDTWVLSGTNDITWVMNEIGYATTWSHISGSNSALTHLLPTDKQVTATNGGWTEERKADRDSWTLNKYLSCFGRQSFADMFTTLPTIEYNHAFIIKVPSGQGRDFDGGVDALTDEELAIATAKGWTLALT